MRLRNHLADFQLQGAALVALAALALATGACGRRLDEPPPTRTPIVLDTPAPLPDFPTATPRATNNPPPTPTFTPTPPPPPTATPIPLDLILEPVSSDLPFSAPGEAALRGGSAQAFAQLFVDANGRSSAAPVSAFADAATRNLRGEMTRVGFLLAGGSSDAGIGQAAAEAAEYVKSVYPVIEPVIVENALVAGPLNDLANGMYGQDNVEIFFLVGLDDAPAVAGLAQSLPRAVFVQQGEPLLERDNYGALAPETWPAQYAAGLLAGEASASKGIAFIAPDDSPRSRRNAAAFHLGARAGGADVSMLFVTAGADCADAARQIAALSLALERGADVVNVFLDCPHRLLEAAEAANVKSIGLHAGGRTAAPQGWLTGAAANWGPAYVEIIGEIKGGTYRAARIPATVNAGLTGLAPFGPSVTPALRRQAEDALVGLRDGTIQPFQGPLRDSTGMARVSAGQTLSEADLLAMDWLPEGIVQIQ